MKIFINAISIKEGGGRVVLNKLLEHFSQYNVNCYVAAPAAILNMLPNLSLITKVPYSSIKDSYFQQLYWYEITLPQLVHNIIPDIFLSITNILPLRRLRCPTLLLVQHAGYFSQQFQKSHFDWYRGIRTPVYWWLKQKWVYRSIKQATAITVQTQALSEQIAKKIGDSQKKIHLIYHGLGLVNQFSKPVHSFPEIQEWRIGYITKFGVQKDFITAFKAIKQLKDQGVSLKLILTLKENSREYRTLYDQMKLYEVYDLIENKGEIDNASALSELYRSLHIFIFPSFCESFGFTLVEAMAFGLPVVVANTKSNLELTQANYSFSPGNADQLTLNILKLMKNPDLYEEESKRSAQQSLSFSWQKAAQDMLALMRDIIL